MPSFTIAGTDLQGMGPVIEVQITVGEALEAALRATGAPVPSPLLVPAMIDTGASITVIRAGLAQQLGLQPVGVRIIRTASDTRVRCSEYRVRLVFPKNVVFETTAVEAPLKGQHIDCLIGRDVLAGAVFIYMGESNLFSLSF